MLFQEYDFEVIVKPGKLNVRPDHLSRLESGEEGGNLDYSLPDVRFFSIRMVDEQFWDIIQFLNIAVAPVEYSTTAQKK